jgi:hypothetical protein
MRLPESDQETVKAQPLTKLCFSDGLPDLGADIRDPLDAPQPELKHRIFQFCRFREVD